MGEKKIIQKLVVLLGQKKKKKIPVIKNDNKIKKNASISFHKKRLSYRFQSTNVNCSKI